MPVGQHHRHHRREGRGLAAGEYGEVPVAQRRVLRHHAPDGPGDQHALPLHALQLGDGLVPAPPPPPSAAASSIRWMSTSGAPPARLRVAGVQPRQGVVDDLRIAAGHGPLEHHVHEVQYALAGAEVPGQRQQQPALAPAIGRVLLQEQPGLRQAEAVDGLLHVPHHEQVVRPADGAGSAPPGCRRCPGTRPRRCSRSAPAPAAPRRGFVRRPGSCAPGRHRSARPAQPSWPRTAPPRAARCRQRSICPTAAGVLPGGQQGSW